MEDINAERMPIVKTKGGEVFANSRGVAAYFGKNHRDVSRSIDNLIAAEPKLALSSFGQGSYTLENPGIKHAA